MRHQWSVRLLDNALGDGVDERVKVEGGKVRIVRLDVDVLGLVVSADMDGTRKGVVQMREGDFVFGSNDTSDNDLVDVVELVPILVVGFHITEQWFEFRPAWQRNVESFRSEEALLVKQVKRIGVGVVRKKLSTYSIQVGHLGKGGGRRSDSSSR